MTSSQVECFFAAAEYGSFTKAAQHLYMTTAAVSKNVLALERELEVTLFWRGPHALSLTPAGTILLESMKRTRVTFSRALEEARALTRDLSGTLTFGFLKGQMLDDNIRTILLRFEEAHPRAELRVVWEDYRWLNEAAAENRLDFVELMESAVKRNPKVRYMPVNRMDTLLVMPRDHPCAGREGLRLADFKDDTIILLSESESLYSEKLMRSTCLAAGFEPKLLYAPNLDTQIFWVELNKGLAVANANHIMANGRAVACTVLPELPPEDFVLVWNEQNGNPLARVFLEECSRLRIN
jgi:DNA-binding transcriptional LysR family regulator